MKVEVSDFLLAKCDVKMTGYWSSSLFELRRSQGRETRQAVLTEQAWLIKDTLYGFWENFFRNTAGSPERAR